MGYQRQRMEDEVALSAAHRAAEGQAHSNFIDHLELRFGKGRPRDVETELQPPLLVPGGHAHPGIDLPPRRPSGAHRCEHARWRPRRFGPPPVELLLFGALLVQ